MAEDEKKVTLKVNLKISVDSEEEEQKLREYLGPDHENVYEKFIEDYVKFAKGGGLLWTGDSPEEQVKMYNKFHALDIGTVTAEPPIQEQEKSPKDQSTEEAAKPEEPKKETAPPPAEQTEEVYETGGSRVVDEPETVEIVLLSYDKSDKSKEFAAYDALRDLVPIDSVVEILRGLDDGYKQPVKGLKSEKNEVREKLTAAGFVLEPEPIDEPEVEIPVSFLTDKDMEAILKVANDDLFASIGDYFDKLKKQIAAIPIPKDSQPVDLNPVLTAISKIPVPQPVDLTDLSTKMATAVRVARSSVWWAKLSCAVGACLFIVALIILISVKMAPTPKIDPTALKTAVSAAMPTASDIATSLASKIEFPTAMDIVTEMQVKGLVAPAAGQGKPAGDGKAANK